MVDREFDPTAAGRDSGSRSVEITGKEIPGSPVAGLYELPSLVVFHPYNSVVFPSIATSKVNKTIIKQQDKQILQPMLVCF